MTLPVHPIRRVKAYIRQVRKERSEVWMQRLAGSRARVWTRMHGAMANGTLDEVKMARFERHMRRLCKLTLPATRRDWQVVALLFYTPITLFPNLAPQRAKIS